MKVNSVDTVEGEDDLAVVARKLTEALNELPELPDVRVICIAVHPRTDRAVVGLANYGSTVEAVYDAERLPVALMGGD